MGSNLEEFALSAESIQHLNTKPMHYFARTLAETHIFRAAQSILIDLMLDV